MKNDDAENLQESIHPPLREHPTKLYVEVTTRCNLSCALCVKQQGGDLGCDGDLSPDFFALLQPAFQHLEALILNGVGEPLLNPNLESFIRLARQTMPDSGWIGFQTNGLLLSTSRAVSLVEAGIDRICLSIDGASPETFRKVREGGELLDIERAFKALVAAKERCNRPSVRVGVEFVAMRSNFKELPDVLRWAARQGASFAVVTHALPYDDQHQPEATYSILNDETVALFEKTREEAVRRGLDIDRYFDARWKYARNPAEDELVSLVNTMREEANRRGLFVDMRKLLQMNTRLLDEVGEVFAIAREVALEQSLDLRLPETTLNTKRRCSFVEEGTAFVSREGRISPCYFLWHRYNCFASGWNQQVTAKVFGTLSERSILEIWNDPSFRLFRQQVITYDFANCSSCSLAPCDYVQTGNFDQDCHIRNVPCGACLWCMGVFQCLH